MEREAFSASALIEIPSILNCRRELKIINIRRHKLR